MRILWNSLGVGLALLLFLWGGLSWWVLLSGVATSYAVGWVLYRLRRARGRK